MIRAWSGVPGAVVEIYVSGRLAARGAGSASAPLGPGEAAVVVARVEEWSRTLYLPARVEVVAPPGWWWDGLVRRIEE